MHRPYFRLHDPEFHGLLWGRVVARLAQLFLFDFLDGYLLAHILQRGFYRLEHLLVQTIDIFLIGLILIRESRQQLLDQAHAIISLR